jgi:CheY-like chemotaxis protein
MNTPSPIPPVILLIEDSDEDYTAFARAIRLTGLQHTLHRCRDGDEAWEFLFQQDHHINPRATPCPSLILLDLNLPGTDGREMLARVKRDERLRAIPLIVLTTSANPRDIRKCYRQGANSYQVKSANFEGFKLEVQRTIDYWFKTVVTPAPEE